MLDFVRNPDDRFSFDAAQISYAIGKCVLLHIMWRTKTNPCQDYDQDLCSKLPRQYNSPDMSVKPLTNI